MIQLEHLPDEGILVCAFEGNWTQDMFRQMLRQLDIMSGIEPLDVMVDLRASRVVPSNLMELMREGIELAQRVNVSVAVITESSLFARLYQVVNAAYFNGQDTRFLFVETPHQALITLREQQAARQRAS